MRTRIVVALVLACAVSGVCAQESRQDVARLIGDTCQACRLSIPATEVDAIRHDTTGTAWYCDNCAAILVIVQ